MHLGRPQETSGPEKEVRPKFPSNNPGNNKENPFLWTVLVI